MVTISSAQVVGLDATLVNVEVDLSPGLHLFAIVGLAEREVQESRERIGVAIRNIGARPPHRKSERLIVNLAPADIKKEGPALDLPIALGFLLASGQARFDPAGTLFAGELGLDGALKPVTGALAMAIAARLAGFTTLYVPSGNGREAALASGLTVKEGPSLSAVLDDLEGRQALAPVARPDVTHGPASDPGSDAALIHGQEQAKRALEIAAAGGHNILFEGPPGTGKTLLARSLATVLPNMDEGEIVEVTKIYSVAGLLPDRDAVMRARPFRNPHHTASAAAMTGGGPTIRPGEITLAHRGVLFLDELAEFQPHVLEALRQPLEDRVITVARAAGVFTFPADFTLVAAMNPCPCGNLGNPKQTCLCTPGAITRYRRRISGPLLDRIDLAVEVGHVPLVELTADTASQRRTLEAKARVEAARAMQRERFRGERVVANGAMSLRHIKTYCALDQACRDILSRAYEQFAMSVRSYYRTVKISRTIADLAGAPGIGPEHVLEALQYRPKAEL